MRRTRPIGEEGTQKVAEVTFSCGHTSDFKDSPPSVRDPVICRWCQESVHVTKVQKGVTRAKATREEPWHHVGPAL